MPSTPCAAPRFRPALSAAVLALALIGAGSKAGLVPLHVWLPLAHPAAPSHVSALMSGVMTKVAVYGFVRIVFDLLGPPRLVVGRGRALARRRSARCSACCYALMQHDLKRLLAYHTVENIGIIFIGLGLALAFRANDMGAAAALALTAALFHVFNHSLFKSLLFFGAGAVLSATGERDMEQPRRADPSHAAYRVCVPRSARAAISALPPFNGFVSEWLTFQAVLLSPQLPQWVLKFLVPAVGAMLALSAALAAACFVKAFGVDLSRPAAQRAATRRARPTGCSLARDVRCWPLLCLLAGILPGCFIDALAPVTQLLLGAQLPPQAALPWLTIVPIAESRSSYNGLLSVLFIAVRRRGSARIVIHRWRLARAATLAGLGLRLSRSRVRPRNTRRAASPSRSAGCSAASCSVPASRSTCRRRGQRAGALARSTARPRVGRALCADRRAW